MKGSFVILLLVLSVLVVCDGLVLERVYENLGSFRLPVDIQQQGNFVYIVEKSGRIIAFQKDNPSGTNTFLDIQSQVSDNASEKGLLGLAFHPNFGNNGRFFVYYSSGDSTILSEFSSSSSTSASVASEQVYLQIQQPFSNHNGGQIQFGPDGNLYIAVGDGGSGNDPLGSGQDTSTLLGNILRINVDRAESPNLYSIPSSNPFANGGGRPEIYAFGLRNPWRFSFDSATNDMWIGDVGQGQFEEISVCTQAGQNFGWQEMEACICTSSCTPSDFILPIHSYGRSVGSSVTGGYVYHGTAIPELADHYIFGDFVSGRIFAIDTNALSGNCGTSSFEIFTSAGSLSTFGVIDGEIHVTDYNSGIINRISPDSTQEPSQQASPSRSPSRSPVQSNMPVDFPPAPASYRNQVSGSDGGRTVNIEWELDGSFIHFKITGEGVGWIALGISSDGSMNSNGEGSDIVMGFLDNGIPTVNDYFATRRNLPEVDEQQNIANTDVTRNGNTLSLQFTRLLDTGDTFQDREITVSNDVFLIWALADSSPASQTSFQRHLARNDILVNLDPAGEVSSSGSPSDTPSQTSSPQPEASSTSSPLSSRSTTSSPQFEASSTPSPLSSRSPTSSPIAASRSLQNDSSESTIFTSGESTIFSSITNSFSSITSGFSSITSGLSSVTSSFSSSISSVFSSDDSSSSTGNVINPFGNCICSILLSIVVGEIFHLLG